MARTLARALGLASALFFLQAAAARAAYRGTDMWSNLVPGGAGGLADRHPLSYYQLDYHVKGPTIGLGGVDANDTLMGAVQLGASVLFMGAAFCMRVAISAFDWAYNIDIIGGRNGTLKPVGVATQNLWLSTFQPLMTTAGLILGVWLIGKLSGRRFNEMGIGALRALLLTAAMLAIIFNYSDTIGRASALSKDFTSAIVGENASDHLFTTFIYKPWVVLQFGGLKHCVDWSNKAPDGYPMAASDGTPRAAQQCRDHLRSHNGYGGYAERFLRYPSGSKARDREYDALVAGKLPDSAINGSMNDLSGALKNGEPIDTNQFNGYKVDKVDPPAADMMQAQGAVQRVAFVFLLCLGIVGSILLLGLLCFASLFAQLGILVLFAATPAMVIAGIFPGAHGFVFAWAKGIGLMLIINVVYAVILRGALTISDAAMGLGGVQGYLPAFLIQAALFFGLFLFRKKLANPIASRREYGKAEGGVKGFATMATATAVGTLAAPVAAAGKAGAAGKARLDTITQQHAKNPNTSKQYQAEQPSSSTDGPRPDTTSPPASAGREHSPMPIKEGQTPAPAQESSASAATINGQKLIRGEEPVATKSFQEDYEKAKVERDQKPAPTPAHAAKPLNGVGRPEPFSQALEQERAKTPSQ